MKTGKLFGYLWTWKFAKTKVWWTNSKQPRMRSDHIIKLDRVWYRDMKVHSYELILGSFAISCVRLKDIYQEKNP